MSFKSRFNNRVRELGGQAKAEKFALRWYKDASANLVSRATKRFIDRLTKGDRAQRIPKKKSIQSDSGYFEGGKIYIFKYNNPKTKDIMEYYDRNPIVLSLGQKRIETTGDIHEFGINLNFLPKNVVVNLLNTIEKAFSPTIKYNLENLPDLARKQQHLDLTYRVAESILSKKARRFAYRSYIPSRTTSSYVVSFDSWVYVPLLDIKDLEGISLAELLDRYDANNRTNRKR